MAQARSVAEALDARLAAAEALGGSGWSRDARSAALSRLRRMGMPARRDEYWRFTDPERLVRPDPGSADLLGDDVRMAFSSTDCTRLVFVDGAFRPDLSDRPAAEHLEILPLQEAMSADIHWASALYGRLEAAGHDPVARPLAALNTALAKDGFVLRATGRVPKPVCLTYLRERDDADATVHVVAGILEGGALTLLENGPGAARMNIVMEVDVAKGAVFNHVRVQGRDHQRLTAAHVFARLAASSHMKSFTMTSNGALTRNETVVDMTGDGARATVAGAVVGDGEFLHDDTVFVTHGAEGCESRQVFKKVLRNGAKGVFQGKILVKEGAQKTDGYQISQGLLLDEDSQFMAKPELEIYADDVACSHGSTCGALDPDALFYLMARGIPRDEAESMLVLAFLAEAVEEIEDAELADDVRGRLEEWIVRHRR